MSDENKDPQITGTETPVPAIPVVTAIDIGDGNTFNKDQIIEMRTAKVGLEAEKQTLLGKVQTLETAGATHVAELATANQGRIAAEAKVTTAEAVAKEAVGKAANYVAPGDYQELQKKVGTQEWNTLVERTTRMATQYNIAPEKFHGKDANALDAIEEGLKLGGGNAKGAPVLKGGSGSEAVKDVNQFNSRVEANKLQLERIRGGDKSAGSLG